MDILLVLGSVSSKQYDQMRLALYKAGKKPEIRRLANFDTEDAFVWEAVTSPEYAKMTFRKAHEAIVSKVMNGIRNSFQLSDVCGIVQDATPADCTESWEDRWAWLKDHLTGVPTYVVNNGDDGSFWLEGYGLEEYGLDRTRSRI